MAEDDDSPLFRANASVILIALGSAAFVVTMYHLIALCLCRHHLTNSPNNSDQPPNSEIQASSSFIDENSLAELIPAHKYMKKRGDGDVEGGGEATCAVCLGEFEEGEEVRTLPGCWHCFHVNCIDKWLLSHPNCPVCRADATPSPSPPVVVSAVSEGVPGESDSVAGEHRVDIVAHNALVRCFMLRR